MRDSLPSKPKKYESAIINLDSKYGTGTHWVAYKKSEDCVVYFDSFGDLRPPTELIDYFGSSVKISYNYKRKQAFNSVICGHLCLKFLSNVYS